MPGGRAGVEFMYGGGFGNIVCGLTAARTRICYVPTNRVENLRFQNKVARGTRALMWKIIDLFFFLAGDFEKFEPVNY